MDTSFSVCATEVYQTKYLDYMLKNYENLNMPYPFAVSFGYIASPVLMGRETILCLDEENEVVGAFGYIHGTGEQQYEDEYVIQIQAVCIDAAYRGTRLFLQGLQFLLHHLRHLPIAVTEVVFWIGQDAKLKRLAAKFARLESRAESEYGELSAYRVTLSDLEAYLKQFRTMALA